MSILKCRTLYVQFADDDRGKVPSYIANQSPSAATIRNEEAAMFEEEEDDDVMEAKLRAAQGSSKDGGGAVDGEDAPAGEQDGELSGLAQMSQADVKEGDQ